MCLPDLNFTNVALLLLAVVGYDRLKITQVSKSAPHDLEKKHGDPPFFLPFWQKSIITFLRGKFQKNLYVGTFWVRTSLRTVPTIVIAHTFCASRDTQISYR